MTRHATGHLYPYTHMRTRHPHGHAHHVCRELTLLRSSLSELHLAFGHASKHTRQREERCCALYRCCALHTAQRTYAAWCAERSSASGPRSAVARLMRRWELRRAMLSGAVNRVRPGWRLVYSVHAPCVLRRPAERRRPAGGRITRGTSAGGQRTAVGRIGVLAFNLFRRQLWARCRKGIPSGFHGLRSVSCGCKFTHSAKRGLRGRETRLMDARQLALLARREGFIDPQRSARVSVQRAASRCEVTPTRSARAARREHCA